jgi:hypothetical protein
MSRPALLLLLGFWLGLLVASWLVASATFRTVDRVLDEAHPDLAARLAPVAEPDRRAALRHVAAEVNRWMFGRWAVAQLGLAAACTLVAWRLGGAARWLAVAALAVVVAQTFGLGGVIRDLGRTLDFAPRPLPRDVAGRFGALHGAFAVLDLVKAGLVAALAWLAARQ